MCSNETVIDNHNPLLCPQVKDILSFWFLMQRIFDFQNRFNPQTKVLKRKTQLTSYCSICNLLACSRIESRISLPSHRPPSCTHNYPSKYPKPSYQCSCLKCKRRVFPSQSSSHSRNRLYNL